MVVKLYRNLQILMGLVYPLLDNKIKYKKTNKRFIKILTIGRLSEEKID